MEEPAEEVVIENVALLAAAGTTTLGGTCAAAVLELASVTVAPPPTAGSLKVTVPCELLPPNTLVGLMSPMPQWELLKSLTSDSLFE